MLIARLLRLVSLPPAGAELGLASVWCRRPSCIITVRPQNEATLGSWVSTTTAEPLSRAAAMRMPMTSRRWLGRARRSLVGEDHGRFDGECTGDGDALHLSAAHLPRPVRGERAQSHAFQPQDRRVGGGAVGHAVKHHRQGDVFDRRQFGQQLAGLEDEAEVVAAQFGALGVAHAAQVAPRKMTVPAVGLMMPASACSKVDLPEPDGPITLPSRPPGA